VQEVSIAEGLSPELDACIAKQFALLPGAGGGAVEVLYPFTLEGQP
jgi:hypothetical protein